MTTETASLIFREIYNSISNSENRVVLNNSKSRVTPNFTRKTYSVFLVFDVVGLEEQSFEVIREVGARA